MMVTFALTGVLFIILTIQYKLYRLYVSDNITKYKAEIGQVTYGIRVLDVNFVISLVCFISVAAISFILHQRGILSKSTITYIVFVSVIWIIIAGVLEKTMDNCIKLWLEGIDTMECNDCFTRVSSKCSEEITNSNDTPCLGYKVEKSEGFSDFDNNKNTEELRNLQNIIMRLGEDCNKLRGFLSEPEKTGKISGDLQVKLERLNDSYSRLQSDYEAVGYRLNLYVDLYNKAEEERKQLGYEYCKLLDSYNTLLDKYNSLIGTNTVNEQQSKIVQ